MYDISTRPTGQASSGLAPLRGQVTCVSRSTASIMIPVSPPRSIFACSALLHPLYATSARQYKHSPKPEYFHVRDLSTYFPSLIFSLLSPSLVPFHPTPSYLDIAYSAGHSIPANIRYRTKHDGAVNFSCFLCSFPTIDGALLSLRPAAWLGKRA